MTYTNVNTIKIRVELIVKKTFFFLKNKYTTKLKDYIKRQT